MKCSKSDVCIAASVISSWPLSSLLSVSELSESSECERLYVLSFNVASIQGACRREHSRHSRSCEFCDMRKVSPRFRQCWQRPHRRDSMYPKNGCVAESFTRKDVLGSLARWSLLAPLASFACNSCLSTERGRSPFFPRLRSTFHAAHSFLISLWRYDAGMSQVCISLWAAWEI